MAERFQSPALLLHHLNGSLFQERCLARRPDGRVEWNYTVPHADFTNPAATQAFLGSARSTLTTGAGTIDGVFVDSAGDLRTAGGADMHLNQTAAFEAAWNTRHAELVSQLQLLVTEIIGPAGLVVANNADRPGVLGRNFETLGPGEGRTSFWHRFWPLRLISPALLSSVLIPTRCATCSTSSPCLSAAPARA